jgi:hypothetical protein
MKKLSVLLLTFVLFLSVTVTAYSHEIPDPDRSGSITFLMDYNESPLLDGSLTMYMVGEVAEEDGNFSFALIPELQDSGISMEDLSDAELAEQLALVAAQKSLPGITTTIEQGKAVFSDVAPGLYVVTQAEEEASEGFAPIHPFLSSLPRWENGSYVYDMTAEPKVSLEIKPDEPDEPPEPDEPDEPYLPQTGQLYWPVPLLAIGGLMLFAIGWFLCFGKRDDHEK